MLTTISKSDTLPITLDDVKSHLMVEHDLDDDLITDYIWQAIAYCEESTGSDFTQAVYDLAVPGWNDNTVPCWNRKIVLPKVPVSDVTSVKYYDSDNVEQTLSSSSYYVFKPTFQPAFVEFDSSITLPTLKKRSDAVTIRFTAGYATLPHQARGAILLLVGSWYENRQAEITGTITTTLKLGAERLLAQISHVWGA